LRRARLLTSSRRVGPTTRFAQEHLRLAYRPQLLVRPALLDVTGLADARFVGLLPRGPAQLVEHFTTVCDYAFLEALESKRDELAGACR